MALPTIVLFAATYLVLPAILSVHAAPIAHTTQSPASDSTALAVFTKSVEQFNKFNNRTSDARDLSESLPSPDQHESHAWAYLVAKLLAGLAGLIAIFILIFWLWRRRVRGRRRRIGEMMGLGLKRNGLIQSEIKTRMAARQHWIGIERFSYKDIRASRWRRDDEAVSDEEELVSREGERNVVVGT